MHEHQECGTEDTIKNFLEILPELWKYYKNADYILALKLDDTDPSNDIQGVLHKNDGVWEKLHQGNDCAPLDQEAISIVSLCKAEMSAKCTRKTVGRWIICGPNGQRCWVP